MKCNETIGKWCKNKHGASKIIDTLETYHGSLLSPKGVNFSQLGGRVMASQGRGLGAGVSVAEVRRPKGLL
jgi:hypothetical protein